MEQDRATTLLMATFELLKKQKNSGYVLNLLEETVFYDEADCDGNCLMEDIAMHLEYDLDENDGVSSGDYENQQLGERQAIE